MTYKEWPLGKLEEHQRRKELDVLTEMGYTGTDPRDAVDIVEKEVAALVPIPLAHFGARMKTERMDIFMPHIQQTKSVPAIRYNDYLIWGATAMMLFELRDRLDLKNKYE